MNGFFFLASTKVDKALPIFFNAKYILESPPFDDNCEDDADDKNSFVVYKSK